MQIVESEMRDFVHLVEEGAKALAPEDEGTLVDSINSEVHRRGNSVEGQVGTNLEYAMIRHEAPYRGGSHPKYDNGSKFPNYYIGGRGAGTRAKGSWKGFPAGRKYLENALRACEPDYDHVNTRIWDRFSAGW
ncbi:putative tail protein [Bacillus phage vB_BceS-M2]